MKDGLLSCVLVAFRVYQLSLSVSVNYGLSPDDKAKLQPLGMTRQNLSGCLASPRPIFLGKLQKLRNSGCQIAKMAQSRKTGQVAKMAQYGDFAKMGTILQKWYAALRCVTVLRCVSALRCVTCGAALRYIRLCAALRYIRLCATVRPIESPEVIFI
jgi:hypothetical protein